MAITHSEFSGGWDWDAPIRDRRAARIVALVTAAFVTMCSMLVSNPGAVDAAGCDRLRIPTVGVERCVVPGDQPEIDAGAVVRVDDLSTPNGHWVAGHRTSHGGTFGALTGLRLGDVVGYRDQVYEIVEYTVVRFTDPGAVLSWTTSSTPTLVLQTSRDGETAHLWRGVATTAAVSSPPVPEPAITGPALTESVVVETPVVQSAVVVVELPEALRRPVVRSAPFDATLRRAV